MREKTIHFAATRRLLQRDKRIRHTEITIVLWNFVLEDEMIPECIPSKLGYHPMILMKVVPIVGEHDIR